jgi:hypothetical protein
LQCPEKSLLINEVLSIGLIGNNDSEKDRCFFGATDKCA